MYLSQNDPNPARLDRLPHIPLQRLGAGREIAGVITCNHSVDKYTHYIGNRTLPCIKDDCPGCAAQRRKGWERYVSLWTTAPSKHVIVCMPPDAAFEMDAMLPNNDNLRGWFLTLTRAGKRANGRVSAQIHESSFREGGLPPAPDLLKHMYKIWGLDLQEINEDHPLWNNRFQLYDVPGEENGARPRQAK